MHGAADLTGRDVRASGIGHGWTSYGGDTGGHRYSQARQITPANVAALAPAWRYRTGDLARRPDAMRDAASEGTPILVEGSLVFCTPFNEVIALDPGTGSERWRFDPGIDLQQRPANQFVCRGVAYWQGEDVEGHCSHRILMGTNDARLIALDARSGQRCADFGEKGQVHIDPGMELWWAGEYQVTSPPVVIGDTVILGSAISDNVRVVAPAGTVRAFDVRSGALAWTFDPIARRPSGDGEPVAGHANVWAPMSVDVERELIFLPTSSPSPDFYGGLRLHEQPYANAVVALHARTGEVAWSFQTVHHDLWDYDLPAQPGLYTVWKNGRPHDVVAQVTKTGMVFVLDRDSGKPFLPVTEKPVPRGAVDGEVLSATQPFPVTPPIVPQSVSADEAFGITWFDRNTCRQGIAESRSEGLFTPPSEQGTLLIPFTGGGANWGSAAYDPARNLLVVNMSNMVHRVTLFPADQVEEMRRVFHDQEVAPQQGAPWGAKREVLLSRLGLPCNMPPWGVIAGIDLATGSIIWRRTLGTTEDLAPGPALKLGTPNVGGPAISAGGLVFIGAAMDDYLRAFDVATGEELWKGRLPAGGQATPMIYEWQGRQFVVIYAGGHARLGTRLGDYMVAFALPEGGQGGEYQP
ncbi:pyrroloquinoline quinone-dependent dehydrogenase [Parahaliea maris]|uniref:Pyrroloquinoline quinone-dependent dehydrogenase n=1 Tax=Parahaliea maris TaxID=2716870 RepID=A0A5C8ZR97_9GAMM|nr:pyrroloquinoline quinone-dependent dehydrogenase [Parahaliea maris]